MSFTSSDIASIHKLNYFSNLTKRKKPVKGYRLLIVIYGKYASTIRHGSDYLNVELLDDDPTQIEQQLTETLIVQQETHSKRLREMGKVNKIGKWVTEDLNERQMVYCKVTCEILLERHERKSFLYLIGTGNEK